MTRKQLLYLVILTFQFILLTNIKVFSGEVLEVSSPDKNIIVEFVLKNGNPCYKVTYQNQTIIDYSALGFIFKDIEPVKENLRIMNTSEDSYIEKWETVWGTSDSIFNEYKQLIINLEEKNNIKRKVSLVFRIFNDGLAFRYVFPEQAGLNEVTIIDELTEFNLLDDHNCWWIPGDYDSYEYLYNNTKLSEIDLRTFNYETRGDRNHPNPKAVNTPITMETDEGIFLSFHEANLTDYAGMTLEVKDSFKLEVDLVPWSDGTKVKTNTPFSTPWRTVLISKNAEGLLNSNLIINLNEPNILSDVSWIEPMKYIGIWWEMHLGKSSWSKESQEGSWANSSKYHGANTENAKTYIDFASENNIKGVLIEGWNTGWEYWGADTLDYFDFITTYSDFDIREIVNYANKKGVELVGHHETGGQAANYEKHLDNAFSFYHNLGVRAVKTGYAGQIVPKGEYHHGQYMVRHYRKVLETAAKYNIMIDAHEPIMATGLRRTFPNMMTREGVRGMEWNAWSEGNTPEHTTVIPFTRMLSGPIDYTPGIFDLTFDKYKDKERVYTTIAKQLAHFVIIYSPLQMAADLPENYQGHPAFEFIKKVPVDWNESVYLNSSIGNYVTIARRNGDKWYLGSISDENFRSLIVPLSFLDTNTKYNARIFKDGKNADWETNPTDIEIIDIVVDRSSKLEIQMAKGGGQAIIFEPIN